MAMATVHPIRSRSQVLQPDRIGEPESVLALLGRLLRLELELGLAETRTLLVSAAIAIGVIVVAAVALIASIVVLVAGAVAPLFGAPWQHLVVAGGGLALLALAAIAWSVWRLRTLDWPTETIKTFEENWRWLGAQLRSRLTLR
jgi:uncharacterized membrane protein YqjE